MTARFTHLKQFATTTGLALTLLAVGSLSLLGGPAADAAKDKKAVKGPNIAIQSITLEPHPEAGHKYVVVQVANIGNRNASGFSVGMAARRQDGTVRAEEFSLPLTVPKGTDRLVRFRLGCNWIDFGTVTARTDPSPVPGESPTKIANNDRSVTFGDEC